MAKPKIDPFDMFVQGHRFFNAHELLYRYVPKDQLMYLHIPCSVLAAFAIELYMKCIVCIETGHPPKGHHLALLYKQISPQSRKRIEELWDDYVKDRGKVWDPASNAARSGPLLFIWQRGQLRARAQRGAECTLLLLFSRRFASLVVFHTGVWAIGQLARRKRSDVRFGSKPTCHAQGRMSALCQKRTLRQTYGRAPRLIARAHALR